MTAMLLAILFSADPQTITGRCVSIIDGDTITVLLKDSQIKIRLAGIDAPEKGQPWGDKAREALGDLVHEKDVSIKTSGKDSDGKTLGTVTVGTVEVNSEMVRRGMAWRYLKDSKNDSLAKLEKEAKGKRFGLWSAPNPIPPWEWRRDQKVKK